MLTQLYKVLHKPIDASALAVFRIMFGGLMLFESINYGLFLCLDCMYRQTDMLFKYHRFEWVNLWPGHWLEIQFMIMAICAVGIMLGYYYRFCLILFTLGFAYLFFLDQVLYLNHFYLVLLFCGILIFLPANAYWSLDAKRSSAIASATVPKWTRIWLLAQLEIVLLYAGLVKLNWDWLNLEPMRLWMNEQSQDSLVIFQWLTQDWGIAAASYGVILVHLLGAPLLLWRKTRFLVFCVYAVFHTINAFVFNIGIFPWMTLAATLLVFDPDWPKQFGRWLQTKGYLGSYSIPPSMAPGTKNAGKPATLIVVCMTLWLIAQVLVPLRHHFYPGNVAWNEAGHRFSWRMKLRAKRGYAQFYVVVNDAPAIKVNPNTHLSRKQIFKMSCIPDLIWQYGQFLEQQYQKADTDNVQVYVDASCSLNAREPATLINRLVDLTSIPRTHPVNEWVLPLNKPIAKPFLPL